MWRPLQASGRAASTESLARGGRTMPDGHGDADRLTPAEQIDTAALDGILSNQGQGDEGVRMAHVIGALGPRHFGKMFPRLPAFRPPDHALTDLGLNLPDSP